MDAVVRDNDVVTASAVFVRRLELELTSRDLSP